jgi:predicted GNAT superfamily acetyltransferase
VAELFADVWGTGAEFAPISPDLLRAFSHTSNYVAGARRGSELVGASVGFVAGDGSAKLHSHITGIRRSIQATGIGFALKLHQRAWSLEHDLPVVTWTFDPLVRRNAFFNLTKLGAQVSGFYANFYGAMNDQVNAKDESDRCEVTWDLRSARVGAACEGLAAEPEVESLLAEGAVVVLDDDGSGKPRAGRLEGDVRLCWVPADILSLRSTNPQAARAWRLALRDTLGASIQDGFVASAVTRSGWYVVRRSD